MRKRLYRGVVKRACDDPGCDREWPCERHGAPIKYWQKQDHMHAACMKAGMTLEQAGAAVACSARDLDKRACAGCGYVVCACVEEETREYEGAELLRDRPIDWTMFRPSAELAEELKALAWKSEPVTREDLDAYLSAHTSWSRVEQVARDEAKQRYTYFGFMGSAAYPTWTTDDEVRAWKAQRGKT